MVNLKDKILILIREYEKETGDKPVELHISESDYPYYKNLLQEYEAYGNLLTGPPYYFMGLRVFLNIWSTHVR